MTARVTLIEMGPRDGLQNEPNALPPGLRAELALRLRATGLPKVEAAAFVSPKWVPQMAGAADVLAELVAAGADLDSFPVLTPNLQGYQAAVAAGAREVAVFGSASEGFSRANVNASIAEALDRFRPVCAAAAADGVRVRGYVSCVLGCPFDGAVDPGRVAEVAAALDDMGCYEISLGDTIGVGTAGAVRTLLRRVAQDVPHARLAAHFHDTYGQALANLLAALEDGVRVIDASVAGLGGCPYAPGATGNVATEDVVYLLDGLGMETGVDLDRVAAVGAWISERLGRPTASRAGRALAARATRRAAPA